MFNKILVAIDYSGLKEIFIGSVSNHVMHYSLCSILLVKAAP
jgi:nucleotide-binding universal stress UspA family protein